MTLFHEDEPEDDAAVFWIALIVGGVLAFLLWLAGVI